MLWGFLVPGLPKSKVSDLTVMPQMMQCSYPVCKSGRVFPMGDGVSMVCEFLIQPGTGLPDITCPFDLELSGF